MMMSGKIMILFNSMCSPLGALAGIKLDRSSDNLRLVHRDVEVSLLAKHSVVHRPPALHGRQVLANCSALIVNYFDALLTAQFIVTVLGWGLQVEGNGVG